MKHAIIGAGGFAREVYHMLPKEIQNEIIFFVEDQWYKLEEVKTKPLSLFDPLSYKIVVAIGDPIVRKRIIDNLPIQTHYYTIIDPSVIILSSDVKIGEGSIICAGSIITTNVIIGKHTHLNLQTTVGHDTVIDDFFTSSPGTKISGNCKIGKCVYVGTNASIREKVTISDNVIIGMNSAVVKHIDDSGVYVGIPCKKIKDVE
jgi:sugar O-acyltransferase (sialic acid O-acetyltransferase NeuD family)